VCGTGAELAVVNLGPTRADDLADVKVEALAGEAMMKLATHPSLLIPRI
jgi:NAD-dependent deacetylase sirtuin 4